MPLALALRAALSRDRGDATISHGRRGRSACSRASPGWRIAYSLDLGYCEVDTEVVRNTETALEVFRQLGCTVEEVDLGWIMTYPFNMLSRCPVMSVPSGRAGNGVPTGIQIVARTYDDVSVFRAAAAYERARGWLDTPDRLPEL